MIKVVEKYCFIRKAENYLLLLKSEFTWNSYVDDINIVLNNRISLLKRIKQRVPRNKMAMIAEAIFNSKIRYGISVYLNPIYDHEDLKANKRSNNIFLQL